MPTSFQSFSPGDLIEDTHVEQFIEPIQNLEAGKSWYGGSATGSANAFAVDLDPAPAAYTAGMIVHFKANNTVSGASTLNLNSLGNKALVKEGNTSLVSGDIVSDQLVAAVYDGTQFQLVSPVLNPTVTTSPPTENVLVYAESTAKQTSGTQTNISLPSFVFDNTKSYLMEVYVQPTTSNPNVRVTLNDGTTSYAYPSPSTYITGRGYYAGHEVAVKLPTLSGSHTITVNASYIGYVQVKIWEIYDNLVYADFTTSFSGSISSTSLASFTATSGHRYKLTMKSAKGSSGYPSASCYLDDGTVITGIPQSGPTTQEVEAGYYEGEINVSRVLTGLSGSYSVTVRGMNATAITVRIYDIT